MVKRTEVDIEKAVERTRRAKAAWRSTPEGEADYQATVARVFAVADRLRAKTVG